MPIQTDSLNRKLYDLLNTRGYNPVPRDSDVNQAGKTVAPEEADVFKFTFKKAGEDIDDVWVTVDKAQNLIVYYDFDVTTQAGDKTPGSQFDDSWYGLLNHLKKWAHARQLSFKLEPKEKLDSDMAQRTYMKKKEQIAEGYYPMGKTASYNDAVPTVKIILQHTRQIQEGEQRYRNVAKIFLENTQGERILSPTNKPGLAQIYARHIAEGGVPNDDRWNHLKSLCEEYSKMAGFVRAVRGNQFNESAQRLVNEGLNHYQSLRESLGKLRGSRGYNAYFESWTPALMENEGDEQSNLNELFVQETLDPRIESVMPILNKLSKNLGEMREVSELAEWADSLLEGGDGGEASEEPEEQLDEAPGAETLAHNQATEKSRLDAFDLDESEVEEGLGDIVKKVGGVAKKIGGKVIDTFGHDSDEDLIKDLQKKVGMPQTGKKPHATYNDDVEEGILDTVKKVGGKVLDTLGHGSDEDLIRKLQKSAGVPQTGKKPEAPHKEVDEGDGGQEALNPIGIPEGHLDGSDEIDSPVASAILRRILMQRTDLLAKHGPEAVSNAIGDVADFVGDVDEIGSSDVSGWIKQVEQSLGVSEGMAEEVDMGQYDAVKSSPKGKEDDDVFKAFREKVRQYGDELDQRQKEKEVSENLDADQKRVGQLGPTEKVKNNNIGKLVGANESINRGNDDLAAMMRIINR